MMTSKRERFLKKFLMFNLKYDKTYTWIFGVFAKWLEKTAYLESEMTNLKSFVLKLHTFILPYLMATLNFWPFSKCLGLFWYSYSVLLYCLGLQCNSVLYVFWICVFISVKLIFFSLHSTQWSFRIIWP